MKIGGPKGPGPLPPTPLDGPDQTKASERPSFSEILQGGQACPSEGPAKADLAAVSARLEAGEIDGTQAVELIIDSVVRAKLGSMSPAIQEQLRQGLRQVLTDDPLLAAKIRRLAAADK